MSEETQELLSSLLWKKKLSGSYGVVMKMDRGPRRSVIVAGAAAAGMRHCRASLASRRRSRGSGGVAGAPNDCTEKSRSGMQ